MMPALIVILLILIVRVLTLPGAGEGIKFYLKPDFSLITPAVFAAAVGQVFFSLNVGTTGMRLCAAHRAVPAEFRRQLS